MLGQGRREALREEELREEECCGLGFVLFYLFAFCT